MKWLKSLFSSDDRYDKKGKAESQYTRDVKSEQAKPVSKPQIKEPERVLPIKTMDNSSCPKQTYPKQAYSGCDHLWNFCSPEQCIKCGKYSYQIYR